MINHTIAGISNALYEAFGYENFKNEILQDLTPPCFYISCMEQKTKKYIGTRSLRKNQFVIQYFPHTDDRKGECYDVGEKMLECLEVIPVDGFLLRGTEMRFEIVDGVLHFFVDYNAFSHKEQQKETMGSMNSDIQAKG
ncbi:MAG: hypothetical protein HFG32_07535 [Eubacterium sp.]|nr:hypothetical protein [Eubacterium sp.]